MSYLIIMVIGVITGWVGGMYIKGSEMGVVPDLIAGGVGAAVLVMLSRVVGMGDGFVMSAILAIAGAFGTLFAMRMVLKEKPVPVTRRRR